MRPRPTSLLRSAARFLLLLLALALAGRAGAEVIVSNLTTSQRPDGSGLVDIRFDLATDDAATTQTFVIISVSPDSGQSWPISSGAAYFAGDVGNDVTIGTGKHVVWDAAADRPEVLWPNCRIRVDAWDGPEELTIMLPGDVPLVLVRIPAGTFVMGSPEDERSRDSDEGPQTNVTISHDFYMGKYEVTQAQWLALMGSWPSTAPTETYGVGSDNPAYNVSWDDAQSFITALNAHIETTAQGPAGMRLPTDAEWEYACRGGTTTPYSFGDALSSISWQDDGILAEHMWYGGNNTWLVGEPGYGTKPVGGKPANAFGLHDMYGNLWEWCQDWYVRSLSGGSLVDPRGPAAPTQSVPNWGSGRVLRGGAWASEARYCRSANRSDAPPSNEASDSGFRLASTILEVPPPPVAAATYVSSGLFLATWEQTSWIHAVEEYQFDLSEDPLFSGFVPGYEGLSVGNATSHWVRDLIPGSTYYCRVRARNPVGTSLASNVVSVRMLEGPDELTIMLPGDVPLVMMRIPAGTFVMGSPPEERSHASSESPQTNVTITRAFYMGKYEVTQAQWLAVKGYWPGNPPSATYGVGPDYPAYNLSWNDTENFITALNAHITATGQGPARMRLPTEAEWEYACRGGTTRFSFGDSLINIGGYSNGDECEDDGLRSQHMWYCGNNAPWGTKPAGGKLPNALGLYDMHGNVWEWCQDWYASSLPGGNVIDPTGTSSGTHRVFRGGSWDTSAGGCRSAARRSSAPMYRWDYCGFRLALPVLVTPDPPIATAATHVSSEVFLANWDEPSWLDHVEEYSIDLSEDPLFSSFVPGYENRSIGNTTSRWLLGLTPGSTYYYRVRASNSIGTSMPSNAITVRTTSEGPDELAIALPGDVPLVLVRVPAGTFVMGSPPDERSRDSDEGPQTNVTISQDFYVGKYEVTQAQFLAVMGSWPPGMWPIPDPVRSNHPVYSLSWDAAQNFITALNAHIEATSQGPATMRLPTEAEWEYACRAGTTTRFSFGDSLINIEGESNGDWCEDDGLRSQYMWYCGNNGVSGTPTHGSKPVGGKLPNAFGLYDMHGSVAEWCQERHSGSLPGGSVTDPIFAGSSVMGRVARGGYWHSGAKDCRSAYRTLSFGEILDRGRHGFRIVSPVRETPDVPVATTATHISSGAFRANWNPLSWVHVVDEYRIDVSTDPLFSRFVPEYENLSVGTNASHWIYGLRPKTTYYYRVRSSNQIGTSFPSNVIAVQTLPAGSDELTITLPGDVDLVMARIPAGTFVMGSPTDAPLRHSDEGPQTLVTISHDFYLGKYEVTQAQWLAVMGSWPGATPSSADGEGPDYPAYNISWNDARNFVTALNAHITSTDQGPATMRLPTEAEWEYACRAGTTTRFYYGDSLINVGGGFDGDGCEDDGIRSQYMWYCGNNAPFGQPGYGTKPVGGRLPNAFGLHDMHGNLWEWCQDWYRGSLPGGSVLNPAGPSSGTNRVVRGGFWHANASDCRSADRSGSIPSHRASHFGFRLASVR